MAHVSKQQKQRRQRRRRAKWLLPLRFATMTVAGMAGAWLLFQIMVKVVHPYRLGYEQAQKVAQLKEQLSNQESGNARLRSQVAYLQSEEGAETLARRAGYHRSGEVIYRLDVNAVRFVDKATESAGASSPGQSKANDKAAPTGTPSPTPSPETLPSASPSATPDVL